jgi:gliding motility-associated-like protein
VASFNNISTLPNGAVSELSFAWNFGDGNSSTSFNGANVYADSNAYIISLTATSAAGCVSNTSKSFNSFFKKPVADFEVSAIAICQGKETIFIDKSVAPSSNISSYLWRFGDGSTSTDSSPVKVYNIPGLYTISLQVTTAEGCTADTSQVMRVYLQPKVDAGVSVFIPEGTDYQLQPVVNDTNLLFRWTPANFLSNANVLQPIFRAVQSQWLTLTATGEGNCSGMDTVRITVLKTLNVPNAFSPNGDGINDTWNIPNLADYPGNAVEVYDRYGRSVFRTIGYSMPWNGTMNGKPLPVGTYYYIIDLKQPGYRQITGSITILK